MSTDVAPRPGARAARAAVAVQYVPAAPSCAPAAGVTSSTSTPVHVSGYRVCGPFAAAAGASSFACGASGTGPYRLVVYNGALDGVGRTSSATVKLDGVALLGPSAFDQQVGTATAGVSLTTSSRIDVAIADAGALRLEVVDESQACTVLPSTDVRAATVQATLATTNAFAVPQLQLWNGGVDGASPTNKGEVQVDGALVISRTDVRPKVSAVVAPLSLRPQSKLSAHAGEKGLFTLQVIDRDETPPAFGIEAPGDGVFTNQGQITVSGQIDDPSAVVNVNGAPAAVAGGRFGAQVALAPCWNTIQVQASDSCGNASAATIRVGLDPIPPVAAVVTPPSGLVTNQATQHVLVRYSDDFSGVDVSSVRVSLDGADVSGTLSVAAEGAAGDLTVSEGRHTLRVELADRAGNTAAAESSFTVDVTPPSVSIVAPADGSSGDPSPVAFTVRYADALSGIDLSTLAISLDGQDVTSAFAAGPVSASASIAVAPGPHQLVVSVADLTSNVAQTTSTFGVKSVDTGPPDPARVAPPNELTVTTDIAASTAFLYTGQNPVQPGVAPGTIDPLRVAVIRGEVAARDGSHVPGVRVTISGHPELGSTVTRSDGMFDIAVNGGGQLTLNFQKDGYLPAQRHVTAPWRDFAWAEPVVLVAFDTATTEIQPGALTAQVARGSAVTDGDGTRQATMLFPAGTSATMQLHDGSSSTLGTFHVRATEYTVGVTGRTAMPAELPSSTAYTYAVELSVDEAILSGAQSVTFSQPVPVYLENFLGIPVGLRVPAGFYDRARGVWVPSDDGRVIKILSTTGGVAAIDANGDGVADDTAALTSLGITADEARQLATLYAPGQTLWRVPVPHFSTWDFNYGWGCEPDSEGQACPQPVAQAPDLGGPPPDPDSPTRCGSIIDCGNQGLGEQVEVTGTDFKLSYSSLRQLGRKSERTVTLHMPTKLSSKALHLVYEVYVAGQRLTQKVGSSTQGTVTYLWDGRDAYGRPYQGAAPVIARIGASYRPVYATIAMSTTGGRAFTDGQHGSTFGIFSRYDNCDAACPLPDGAYVGAELVSWTTWRGTLNSSTALPQGLGGWTLSPVHEYDFVAKTLRRGDGTFDATTPIDSHVMSTRASTGWPVGMAVAPDGSIYTAEDWNVKKVDPSGKSTIFAGGGSCSGPQSGVPATQVCLHSVWDLALGPDGSLYLAGALATGTTPVRRIRSDGIIEDFAGVPYERYSTTPAGDERPAVGARVGTLSGIGAGRDGSVYIVADDRVRKITPDGVIHAFAGNGTQCCGYSSCGTCCNSGDGGPATAAQTCAGGRVAVHEDGSVFLSDMNHGVVRRVRPDGIIERFAGTSTGFGGDGGSALAAKLYYPMGLAFGADGSVFIADRNNNRIRRVSSDGTIETVAGKTQNAGDPLFSGDGGPAIAAQMYQPEAIALDANGNVLIGDSWNARVRQVGAPLPGFSLADFTIASRDGSELYVFSGSGRHLRTLDARTKAVLYSFGRDSMGRVSSITDRAGLVTRIERAGDQPVAVVSPYGQRTSFSLDANGYLSAITNPAGEARRYSYDALGVMATYTDQRGNLHAFGFDDVGRLLRDANPAGGAQQLSRTERAGAYTVSIATALGQTTVHDVATTSTGDEVRTSTAPDGTVTVTGRYGSGVITVARADGSSSSTTFGPDPQFGMQSRLPASSQVRTPSGLTLSAARSASVTLSNPADILSVFTRTDTMTVNGRTTRTTYDATARKVTTVSPAGRTASVTLDDKGRMTQLAPPGVLPVSLQYDSSGRLWFATQGARTTTIGYDGSGLVQAVTDAASRTMSFGHDLAGRVLFELLPGNRSVTFGYDASGNLTSIAPPGRPAHGFGYTAVDQVASYAPPVVAGSGSLATSYDYDADGGLVRELFPDAETLVAAWETNASGNRTGRLAAVTTAYGTTTFGYDGAGRPATISAPGVALGFGYDGFLTTSEKWTGTVAGTVGYAYDTDFRVSGLSVNGTSAARSYDADGLLTATGALGIGREAATGRLSSSTLGVIGTSQTYDSYGGLATFSASLSGTEQYRYELTPDALGRITTKKETVGGVTHTTAYAYDDAGRLWTVTQDGALSATYEYDANGNRLRKVAGGSTEQGSYDDQDRLLSYGAATYTWRPNGELESRTAVGQTTWYAYDRLGNLRQAALPDGRGVEYIVDGRNRRVGKKVNGALVEGFLYEGQLRPVAWLDGSGAVRATFVYGTKVNVPEYMVTASGTYRFVTDHLGSPRLVVNASTGAVAQRVDYDEWGQVLADTAPGFQPFGFAGGLYDRDTGLVRFGARDYEPQTGRWTNKDLLRFRGGLNLYAYVEGDPLNGVDRSGLYTEAIFWGPTGSLQSALGHVSVNVNGTSYSFVPAGMDIRLWSEYPDARVRQGHGIVLNLTPEQEAYLAAWLRSVTDYGKIRNNCGQPIQDALRDMGIPIPDSTLPATLAENLAAMDIAIAETSYPVNGPHQ